MRISLGKKIWLRFCRETAIHTILSNWVDRLQPVKWIFLLGAYNSGTTLLNYLLGQHNSISVLPYEGVVLASGLRRPEDFGWPRMWHKCPEQIGPYPEDAVRIAERTKREWGMCFDRRSPVFVEKSIANSARVPWLAEHFQPAGFIHLVRNGYAVAEGIRRRTKGRAPGGEYSLSDCARQWAVTNQTVRASLSDQLHHMMLTYESLTANPDKELSRIAEFIDIDTQGFNLNGAVTVHGEKADIVNRNDESIERLSEAECREIEAVAGDELEYYGYLRQ